LREHLPFPLRYHLIEERLPAVKQAEIAVRRGCGNFLWIFQTVPSKKGQNPAGAIPCRKMERFGEGEGVIGGKVLGLMAVLMLLLILATPVKAADKTIQLSIPGCAA
jgi:hypothetical protein